MSTARRAPVMGPRTSPTCWSGARAAYIWMGNGGGEAGRMLHSPHYDFNDEALPCGASCWARLVERLLPAR